MKQLINFLEGVIVSLLIVFAVTQLFLKPHKTMTSPPTSTVYVTPLGDSISESQIWSEIRRADGYMRQDSITHDQIRDLLNALSNMQRIDNLTKELQDALKEVVDSLQDLSHRSNGNIDPR